MKLLVLRLLRSPVTWFLTAAVALGLAALCRVPARFQGARERETASRNELRQLDPSRPYRIEFGRGSGWHGLDTVKLLQDGTVALYRWHQETDASGQTHRLFWETTTLKLPQEALSKVLAAVASNGLLGLDRQYSDARVADGTQWVLWVHQGDKEKSVYFDNRFPGEIRRFAADLDRILAENGSEEVAWHRVSAADAGKHQRELWDSIRR